MEAIKKVGNLEAFEFGNGYVFQDVESYRTLLRQTDIEGNYKGWYVIQDEARKKDGFIKVADPKVLIWRLDDELSEKLEDGYKQGLMK